VTSMICTALHRSRRRSVWLGLIASGGIGASPAVGQCPGDLTGNGDVGGADLGAMLTSWGAGGGEFESDLNGDGVVDGADLGVLLVNWGPCPPMPPGLGWATVLDWAPNPAVIADPNTRSNIVATGWPWRVRDNFSQLEMVLIPPGTFNQGCSPSDQYGCGSNEYSVRQVLLTNPYYLGRYEVTQAQWTALMGSNPSYFQTSSPQVPAQQVPKRPVEKVNWLQANQFLVRSGLRFPTEAEWEYAYRAGSATAFHGFDGEFGTNDDGSLPNIAWFSSNANSQTRPVGGKSGNGFGLHDMAGNVFEWVDDWSGWGSSYPPEPVANPRGTGWDFDNQPKKYRGGTWGQPSSSARSSWRSEITQFYTNGQLLGFRAARSLGDPVWATVIEREPDPAVVPDLSTREAILATGFPWRVVDHVAQIELLLVPPGSFSMGCSASAQSGCSTSELPNHAVTLTNALYVGRYEVTQAQWERVVGNNPSQFSEANGYPGSGQRPVEKITACDCYPLSSSFDKFLGLTSMRLPTEAEWEFACRAGASTAFHGLPSHPTGFDDEGIVAGIAWYVSNSGARTQPVGGKFGNGFGLHDMSGNVAEVVADSYSSTYYGVSPATNPPGPQSSTSRVVRGGHYQASASICRSSHRASLGTASSTVGFRVVRSP